jgi:hypothetical protein
LLIKEYYFFVGGVVVVVFVVVVVSGVGGCTGAFGTLTVLIASFIS